MGVKTTGRLILETCNPLQTLACVLSETGGPQQGSEHKRVMMYVVFGGLSLAAGLDHTVEDWGRRSTISWEVRKAVEISQVR